MKLKKSQGSNAGWFKALMIVVVCSGIFVSGAMYGEGNRQDPVIQSVIPVSHVDHVQKECDHEQKQKDAPWISRLAGSIGEGVAITFNGVLVIVSEIISPNAG